jgi:3-oxoacyl-ACP reductase-like protein
MLMLHISMISIMSRIQMARAFVCAQLLGGFMSIFGKIKDAIFGKKAVAATTPAPQAAAPVADAAPAASVAIADVDVIAHLEAMAADNGQKLNWRSSIVDLMKLVGMESSLQERKDLAMELGYTGDLEGSAEMNIWLHKAVMRALAANGGVVPAELLD